MNFLQYRLDNCPWRCANSDFKRKCAHIEPELEQLVDVRLFGETLEAVYKGYIKGDAGNILAIIQPCVKSRWKNYCLQVSPSVIFSLYRPNLRREAIEATKKKKGLG